MNKTPLIAYITDAQANTRAYEARQFLRVDFAAGSNRKRIVSIILRQEASGGVTAHVVRIKDDLEVENILVAHDSIQ